MWGDKLILDGNTTLGVGCTALLRAKDLLWDSRLAAIIF